MIIRDQTQPSRAPGQIEIALILGGAFQVLAHAPKALRADLILYVDVAAELDSAQPHPSVAAVPLAKDHTVGTLITDAAPAGLKRLVGQRPGVMLNIGMSQLRTLAHQGLLDLLRDSLFARFLREQVLEQAQVLANGTVELVRLTVYHSVAGGTGSGCAVPFAKVVSQLLHDFTHATVFVQNVVLGSLTYVGLGERVHVNGAAGVLEVIEYALSADRHPREVRGAILIDLPLVGTDKLLRDQHAADAARALRTREVRNLLERGLSNRTIDSALGAVQIVRVSVGNRITRVRMSGEAATSCLAELRALAESTGSERKVERVQVVAEDLAVEGALASQELGKLYRESKGVRPPDLVQRCTGASAQREVRRIVVTLAGEGAFEIGSDLGASLARPAGSPEEVQSKQGLLASLGAACEAEGRAREQKLEAARRRHAGLVQRVEQHVDLLYPTALKAKMRALLGNPAQRLRELGSLASSACAAATDVAALEAEIAALQAARARMAEELEKERGRVRALCAAAEEIARRSGASAQRRWLQCLPPQATVARLLALPADLRDANLAEALADSVVAVTRAGLAHLIGAETPRSGSIVERFERGEFAVDGPYWGGRTPMSRPAELYVLPPLVDADRPELEAALNGHELVESDCADYGMQAVKLEIRNPRAIGEIFTEFVLKNLEAALADPDVYFTDPDRALAFVRSHLPARLAKAA